MEVAERGRAMGGASDYPEKSREVLELAGQRGSESVAGDERGNFTPSSVGGGSKQVRLAKGSAGKDLRSLADAPFARLGQPKLGLRLHCSCLRRSRRLACKGAKRP